MQNAEFAHSGFAHGAAVHPMHNAECRMQNSPTKALPMELRPSGRRGMTGKIEMEMEMEMEIGHGRGLRPEGLSAMGKARESLTSLTSPTGPTT